MQHPDDGTLMALLDGEIPSDELAPIAEHLSACEECRARLDATRAMMIESDALVGTLGDGAPAATGPTVIPLPHRSRTTLYRNLAWAATVVLAAGAGYALRSPAPAPSLTPIVMEPSGGTVVSGEAPAAAAPDATVGSREQERPAVPPITQSVPAPAPPTAAPATPVAGLASDSRARNEAGAELAQKATPPAERMVSGAQRTTIPSMAGRSVSRLVAPAAEAAPLASSDRTAVDVESFEPIGFAEAIARLGGSIRLVDGLVPDRLEASSSTVRVVYPLQTGELVLEQRLIGDSVVVALRGPVSADSLAVLRRRVR